MISIYPDQDEGGQWYASGMPLYNVRFDFQEPVTPQTTKNADTVLKQLHAGTFLGKDSAPLATKKQLVYIFASELSQEELTAQIFFGTRRSISNQCSVHISKVL